MKFLDREGAPEHLFTIPQLDFSRDLFVDPLGAPWFRLAEWTLARDRVNDVEDIVSRQSLLVAPGTVPKLFDRLDAVGNALHGIGTPGGSVYEDRHQKTYSYVPFYRFEFPFTSLSGEPLAFFRHGGKALESMINPDIWLFFGLEEQSPNNGIWSDPRLGVEALRRRIIDRSDVIEVRTDYLRKYLKARQMALMVGHYRHLHLFNPSPDDKAAFVTQDEVLGSAMHCSKAILNNWGLRNDVTREPFLQRRLHLWYEIAPASIDVDDPWAEEPPFDVYSFTLPTLDGPVAPARFAPLRLTAETQTFAGNACDFMDRIYFRQDVLRKYEGADGFDVHDDGSVVAGHYWSLQRSTSRLGNELLATAIGDFAEGVPFEEWPYWKLYAVEPPSRDFADTLRGELTLPRVVNDLAEALQSLNATFAFLASALGVNLRGDLWCGSVKSPAGRRLKWFYPANASDEHFLERALFASTFVIDEIKPEKLRAVLSVFGDNLHLRNKQTLGSRKLLERLTLVTALIMRCRAGISEVPALVAGCEGKLASADADLQRELNKIDVQVRSDLAALAFLYDLRTHGGLAHPPDLAKARDAAQALGLPDSGWRRTEYMGLLNQVTTSIGRAATYFRRAARAIESVST